MRGWLERRLAGYPLQLLLGTPSLHASLIEGGQELSSYPASCKLALERRTVPGESAENVEREVEEVLKRLAAEDPAFRYRLRRGLERRPHEFPESEPILGLLRAKARAELGHEPEVRGLPFWTDCAVLSTAGIPTLLFGPRGAGAHAAEEWVDLDSVEHCARVYLETAREFCA
ncbi:N-formyl-4-amino-5-aminomethyl-2-methylpyrimidine deformylase [Calidithermus terrae]|uniref:N-formyl-4-amino-5-aminomethyl-2-methylpyrimidine deformylase n=1 Tax=Calidithermus terrae TaxID=1408545 RepID=A0A399ET33_9DEIN|nr:N-formyl-4-amino-5-aminomethyl-2-methylpyrimidine deformylase [Calidithermus terrae]